MSVQVAPAQPRLRPRPRLPQARATAPCVPFWSWPAQPRCAQLRRPRSTPQLVPLVRSTTLCSGTYLLRTDRSPARRAPHIPPTARAPPSDTRAARRRLFLDWARSGEDKTRRNVSVSVGVRRAACRRAPGADPSHPLETAVCKRRRRRRGWGTWARGEVVSTLATSSGLGLSFPRAHALHFPHFRKHKRRATCLPRDRVGRVCYSTVLRCLAWRGNSTTIVRTNAFRRAVNGANGRAKSCSRLHQHASLHQVKSSSRGEHVHVTHFLTIAHGAGVVTTAPHIYQVVSPSWFLTLSRRSKEDERNRMSSPIT